MGFEAETNDNDFSVKDFVLTAASLFGYAVATGAGWVVSVNLTKKLFNATKK